MKSFFHLQNLKPTNVVFRETSVVDSFHFDSISPKHAGCEAVVVSNPIYVVFNAQRISAAGDFNIDAWIKSMNQCSSDSLAKLRKNVSDEDVCKYLKSRYCQKPSELSAWFEYLSSNIDNLSSEVREFVEKQQASKVDHQDSSENSSHNSE